MYTVLVSLALQTEQAPVFSLLPSMHTRAGVQNQVLF